MRHSDSKTSSSCSHELLAQLDEVRPADRDLLLGVRLLRRREVGVVRQRGVAADAVVVLHPALGRQAVVVPAHRVEDRLAAHPLVARDQVGVRVGEHVADVQAAAHRRRGSVDRVDVLPRLGAVEAVGVVGLPALAPRWPRDPRAPACPVRRRRGAASSRTGRCVPVSRSWPKCYGVRRRPRACNRLSDGWRSEPMRGPAAVTSVRAWHRWSSSRTRRAFLGGGGRPPGGGPCR